LVAFPVFLLSVLFHEPKSQVVVRERAPAAQPDAPIVETVGTIASTTESQKRARPTWIAPTPEYDYDLSSIPVPSAAALEAFAMEPSPPTERKDRTKKASASEEPADEPPPRRQVVIDNMDSEMRMGVVRSTADGRQVFDTPPLNPD
jgi:hypothetical protein